MDSINKAFKKSLLFIILYIVVLTIFNFSIILITFKDVILNDQTLKIESKMSKISNSLYLEDGKHIINDEGMNLLSKDKAWAMLLDKDNGSVKWSAYLPREIPRNYTLTDVSKLSRYYLKDYPVFIWDYKGDLLIVGFPKDSYTKLSSNYHYIDSIKKIPVFSLIVIAFNILVLLVLFFIMDYFTIKKISPILEGIDKLKEGMYIDLKENGTFSEISQSLNKTSQILEQKDIARANWISSVSHDIRTPLTVIIGHLDSFKRNELLSEKSKVKLHSIEAQCFKIKNLINDLNLYSKIEHDTKFLREKRFNIIALLRKIIVEYMNNIDQENYTINYKIDENINDISILGDEIMLQRALENLINNSIIHNPKGCTIGIIVTLDSSKLNIIIRDDGVGLKQKAYINKDTNPFELNHGLGLIIAKKIIENHNGSIVFESLYGNGFTNIVSIIIK